VHAITALSIGSLIRIRKPRYNFDLALMACFVRKLLYIRTQMRIRPLAWLPSPWNGITLVLASFFIGLATAYPLSKLAGGHGTFLAHLYCLLLCTIPLVTVSGALLLIPATGWLVLMLGSIVSALFIYRMVLHTFTIMAVHRLRASQATTIVLMLPMVLLIVIVLVGLLIWTEGDILACVLDAFSWGGERRRKLT
jgi:hypothetical protein